MYLLRCLLLLHHTTLLTAWCPYPIFFIATRPLLFITQLYHCDRYLHPHTGLKCAYLQLPNSLRYFNAKSTGDRYTLISRTMVVMVRLFDKQPLFVPAMPISTRTKVRY